MPVASPPPVIAAPCPAEATAIASGVRCGFVRVPLDRARGGGATIRIYFERYPRSDRARTRQSTVVSLEGGPGYGVTPGREQRAELWGPVSRRRDLVLVDLRGTGRSAALACDALARSTRGYIARAGRCARPCRASGWCVAEAGPNGHLRGRECLPKARAHASDRAEG